MRFWRGMTALESRAQCVCVFAALYVVCFSSNPCTMPLSYWTLSTMVDDTLEDPSVSSYEQLRSSPCFPRRVMPRLKLDSTRLSLLPLRLSRFWPASVPTRD